jgi:hypothetical protein
MAIVTYEHHGATVFVDEGLKGKHREHCLCWRCESFKPGTPENCPIAEKLYRICVDENLVTPVYECPVYIGPRFQEVAKAAGPQERMHGHFDTE